LNGDVYVAGFSAGNGSSRDFATVKYARVPSPVAPYPANCHLGDCFASDLCGESGNTVVVQVSTNLLDWHPVSPNVLGSEPPLWSDPNPARLSQRFHRLFKP